jgi:hypothetical protein
MALKGPPLVGDASYRVTIPIPKSLKVLDACAEKYFGHSGELKLYHRGLYPILDDAQLASVQDGDFIIVTWGDQKLSTKQVAQMVSTYIEDYVPQRIEPRPNRRSPAAEPFIPHRVTEQSSYASNFVRHEVELQQPPCSPRNMIPAPSPVPTGRTSYADEFVWRDALQRPRGTRQSDDPWKPSQFNAETTYNSMYTVPPKETQGESASSRRGSAPLSSDRVARFEGTSTYRDHYPAQKLQAPPKGQPNLFEEYTPYHMKTTSEYRSEFVQKELHTPSVHLEPELGKLRS